MIGAKFFSEFKGSGTFLELFNRKLLELLTIRCRAIHEYLASLKSIRPKSPRPIRSNNSNPTEFITDDFSLANIPKIIMAPRRWLLPLTDCIHIFSKEP